ncbi:MAG TPA: hypothetical protein VFP64_13270, partial [Pyrinomonadaceae bacterium]|nr:hypothetical protein [Pyrinomonadaceae bacterium]
ALDHRQRFVFSTLYDLPFFRNSKNHFAHSVFGGVSMAATLSLETGEQATVLSGIDSNLNGDPAPDRAIINPNGTANTSSLVTPLLRTCTSFNEDGTCAIDDAARIVGYVATDPNAQYVQAGLGALSNGGRNSLLLPAIKNLDFSIFKNFAIGEGSKKIQLRADFYNAFNHPQYIPGSIDGVEPITTTGVSQINTVGQSDFDVPSHVFSSHPRVIQFALRFDF